MEWTASVDGYCERLDPGFWAEPVNFLTNAAFLVAALVMWRRCRGMPAGQVLAAILFVIGVASGLFHSLGQAWAGAADSLSILVFVIVYLWLANRDFVGFRPLGATLATVAGLAVLIGAAILVGRVLPAAGANAAYGMVAALILGYGLGLLRRAPRTGGRLIGGALILALSITSRAMDMPLCERFPVGTHFLWHLLNATMLGWMIETWRRHRLEAGLSRR